MKKSLLKVGLISSLLLSSNALGQTLTSNSALFTKMVDSFEDDATGNIASPYTTDEGGTITFTATNGAYQQIYSAANYFAAPLVDGVQAWALRAVAGPFSHKADYTFANSLTNFGLTLIDFGDGTSPSAVKITASDGTVMFQHDEAVDGSYPGNTNVFLGITGGSFTGFTIEQSSAGSDNIAIDAIVTIPEPSSLALVGLTCMGLIGFRKRQ